jgi:2-haloacid dehalogenase
MGTCLDWHSSIIAVLPPSLPQDVKSNFALEWRQAYFDANILRQNTGKPPEDIDITHRRVLNEVLEKHPDIKPLFVTRKDMLVKAWHAQKAWPEVHGAIQELKERGWEVFVHANGTTRLQLDIVCSSGLNFDMLFSSELLGCYKPVPENYLKVLDLLKLGPEQCVTVAAHAYDLRGAKAVGMRTVYVYRWTDDVLEVQEIIKRENDAYLNDMKDLADTIARL